MVIGTRSLMFAGRMGFVATVQFDETKPLDPQLLAYANANRASISHGLIACEAVSAIGGPSGKGPTP